MTSATIDRRFGLSGNTAVKAPVLLATTANITLNGEQTIDGVLTASSRVLVWQQTSAVQNGLYDTDGGAWTRCPDANDTRDLAKGTRIAVTSGSTYAGYIFQCTTASPAPGSTAINFTPDSTATTLQALLAGTGTGQGASLIGREGGGTLQNLFSSAVGNGAAILPWLRRLTGAVATTIEKWMGWREVCVFEFLTAAEVADVQAQTALTSYSTALDVTTGVQAAITAAWKAGKRCYMPAGAYKARIILPIYDGVNTYQGDAFELYGDGAANGFLGGVPYDKTTTIIAPDTTGCTLRYNNLLAAGTTSGNHIYIRGIRFEHTSANPVVLFERFSDYSVFERCEIRQHGAGAGLRCLHAYGGTIKNVHSMNDDLVTSAAAVVARGTPRTSIAFDIQTAGGLSGGLLNLEKLTGRGFQLGLSLGTAADGVISTRVVQFEGSTLTNGIKVNAAMVNTVIETPYFEAVSGTCIDDPARSTKVLNGMFFEGYTIGIESRYSNFGNRYVGNHFHLNSANSQAVTVSSDGAATGTKKFIKENFFYFLGSGGTLTGVVGINISGTSPQLDLADNCFRPNRAWVGGAGTAQIVDTSTGRLSGSIVTASALNSFPLLSGVGLSLSYSGNALTQANVAAGVFTIPVDSLLEFIPTVATNVTQIAHEAGGRDRIIVIRISGANATFVKGALMALSANFNPASGGSLTLLLETTAGTTKATELARTAF